MDALSKYQQRPVQILTLDVEGMSCASCVSRVEKAIGTVPGVESVVVNPATNKASVSANPGLDYQALLNAVTEAGYGVPKQDVTIAVEGMSCASCVARVETILKKVPGVSEVSVNLATGKAHITYTSGLPFLSLIEALQNGGYGGTVVRDGSGRATEIGNGRPSWRHAAMSALLSAPLLVPMMAMPFGWDWTLPGWLQFVLATPVQFWLGARYYQAGWKALKARAGNMGLLVAIGTSAAYFLSVYLLIDGQGHARHLYFESSAAIITLVLLGQWLEARAKNQAIAALRLLESLRATMATVRRNGMDQLIPVEEVLVGDKVVIKPGERVPVDGLILEGISYLDESMLTGESLPVSKSTGDRVTGGSINADGLLIVETTAIGGETMLSKIIKLVEEAQAAKAPIQRLVDKVSAVFVPVVLVVSALTFVLWLMASGEWQPALVNAVAVLVIACPCALGLATPVSIMAGTGIAAQYGILIKDVEALETAHAVRHVIFDKTGTLTEGTPAVVAAGAESVSEVQLLTYARAAQQYSAHPLARAVEKEAIQRDIPLIPVISASALPGKGVQAELDGMTVYLGNARLMQDLGLNMSDQQFQAARQEQAGNTISWVALKSEQGVTLVGWLAFGDAVKRSARDAVMRLSQMGIGASMLTGDNIGSAKAVAQAVGISEYQAQVLPADKADAVMSRKTKNGRVAMVGDGINDAPALAAADIGIAMASGTDVAVHTAAITLMRNDPALVADAIEISKKTYRKIWQNLGWAFVYNIVGIPLAALGYLNPVLAGAAMAFSSVSVVTNALLLRRWKPRALEGKA